MPDRKSTETPSDAADAGGKKKSLIVMGSIAIVIAVAGYVLGGRSSGAEPATAPPETVEPSPSETLDEIVELDPVNVNLAGGHYLRIAVAIGLTGSAEEPAEAGHGATDTEAPSIATAPASDLVVSTFAGRDMEVLATVDGREAARRDLHTALTAFYGSEVTSVLFTEFVMQ